MNNDNYVFEGTPNYHFFKNVRINENNELKVTLGDDMTALINLLSVISIQVGELRLDNQELNDKVDELNQTIQNLEVQCTTINNTYIQHVEEVEYREPPRRVPCDAEHTLLDDGTFVNRSGRVVNHQPSTYNWGGWNIVGRR